MPAATGGQAFTGLRQDGARTILMKRLEQKSYPWRRSPDRMFICLPAPTVSPSLQPAVPGLAPLNTSKGGYGLRSIEKGRGQLRVFGSWSQTIYLSAPIA